MPLVIHHAPALRSKPRSISIRPVGGPEQQAKWWIVSGFASLALGGILIGATAEAVTPQRPSAVASAESGGDNLYRSHSATVTAGPIGSSPRATPAASPDAPQISLPDYQISKDAAVRQAAYYEGISFITGLVPLPGHHVGEAANATTQILANLAGQLRDVAADPDAIAVGVHPALNLKDVVIYPIFPLEGRPRKPDPTV